MAARVAPLGSTLSIRPSLSSRAASHCNCSRATLGRPHKTSLAAAVTAAPFFHCAPISPHGTGAILPARVIRTCARFPTVPAIAAAATGPVSPGASRGPQPPSATSGAAAPTATIAAAASAAASAAVETAAGAIATAVAALDLEAQKAPQVAPKAPPTDSRNTITVRSPVGVDEPPFLRARLTERPVPGQARWQPPAGQPSRCFLPRPLTYSSSIDDVDPDEVSGDRASDERENDGVVGGAEVGEEGGEGGGVGEGDSACVARTLKVDREPRKIAHVWYRTLKIAHVWYRTLKVDRPARKVMKAMRHSYSIVVVMDESQRSLSGKRGKTIGVGRAISDGSFVATICDVAVLPEYQQKGVGRRIVRKLIQDMQRRGPSGYAVFPPPLARRFFWMMGFRYERKYSLMAYHGQLMEPSPCDPTAAAPAVVGASAGGSAAMSYSGRVDGGGGEVV
ncbi:unnamed protein product [Closterium sp. Naga37s-1]|nr:unnamed protein product [Closterium sp. Naga37s-1]